MIKSVIILFLTTLIPGLELRASIPVGFFSDIHNSLSSFGIVGICFFSNVLLGMVIFSLMGICEKVLRKWQWFDSHLWPIVEGRREKLRPLVDKYGVWGVAVFIGIPLPGTGAYTGAIGAYLLKLDKRRFWIANFVGVLVAAIAVTSICLLVQHGVLSDDSFIKRLFIKEQ